MTEIESSYSSTNRATDERLLIAGLTSFNLRKDVTEVLETSGLEGEHFFNPNLGSIWDAGRKLAAENRIITPELLSGAVENDAEKRLISSLAGEPVRLVEVTRAVEIVLSAAKRRSLLDVTKRIVEQVRLSEDYDEVLAFTHEQLAGLDSAEASDHAVDADGALADLWETIDGEPDPDSEPISTSIFALDERLNGGIRRKQLMVIAGRPNAGKSIFAIQMAGDAVANGLSVALFSAEMSQLEVTKRLIASVGRVKYKQLIQEELDDVEREKAEKATDMLKGKRLRIFDPPAISLAYIRQQCRLMQREEGLDVVVIDYIQILNPADKRLSREQQIAELSWGLKTLARELDVVVVTAAQLNRGNTMDRDARPDLKDLRESDRLSQDSDVVVIVHHPPNKEGDIELLVAKNRNGSRGVETRGNAFHEARIA